MLNLVIARMRKRMTQRDLAKAMEVSVTTICKWETGKVNLQMDKLIRLADMLEVSIDYLVGRTDKF